jgi:radical SAM superfamily enzyme YgiQ (UPF0313 family)
MSVPAANRLDLLILHPPNFIRRNFDEALITFKEDRLLPLGGLHLATYLRRRGFRVMVAPLAEFYQERGCYLDYDDGTEAATRRFTEKSRKVLATLIAEFRPATVGIGLNFSLHHRSVEILLDLLRDHHPGLRVILGGQHATFTAESWLQRSKAPDLVLLGEAEISCHRLLISNFRPDDFSGLAVRNSDGRIVLHPRTAPLSEREISEPIDYDLAIVPRWTTFSDLTHNVVFSRGCSWHCTFCASPAMWGRHRYRDPEAVATEIGSLHSRGIRDVYVCDDAMIPTSPAFAPIAEVLGRFNDMRFGCLMRADHLARCDPKVLKEANIDQICVGIESFSAKVRKAMNKQISPRTMRSLASTFRRMRQAGLKILMLIMVGHPGGSYAEDLKTVRASRKLALEGLLQDICVSHTAPFPGTVLAKNTDHGFRLVSSAFNTWNHSEPIIELQDSGGRVRYSVAQMREVFQMMQDIRREFLLGPWQLAQPPKR